MAASSERAIDRSHIIKEIIGRAPCDGTIELRVSVTRMERRVLEAVIYEREPPIARIILNRVDKANTKDAVLVTEVDTCLHEADRDKEIKVVILKANGKGFCGGHVARWGPHENPYPDFGNTFEDLYKGTADLFLWPTLYLWEFPKPTISQIHGYCMGGGIYLGLLTDFCVASEDAYFQMPLAQSLGEPGGHTMIEPWLLMNWHRTMDWLLLAPTLSASRPWTGACSTGWCRARTSKTSSRRWRARSPRSR